MLSLTTSERKKQWVTALACEHVQYCLSPCTERAHRETVKHLMPHFELRLLPVCQWPGERDKRESRQLSVHEGGASDGTG